MVGGKGAVSPGQSATGGNARTPTDGVVEEDGGSGRGGLLEQATRIPTIAAHPNSLESRFMVLILLEALGALLLLVLIVWWTMFSGRNKGELPEPDEAAKRPDTVKK